MTDGPGLSRVGGFDHPFALDPFQIAAMEALDVGENVLVAAPTGSGKTVVAEHAVSIALSGGGRAFYTAPIKALSNQKYNDLTASLGAERVGLLTGDHAINGEADVLVMTTEVLRNMVYANSEALTDLRWVVLDEVHFLADEYRGPVWEEVLIHTPEGIGFVCLSATVSNATELGDWISQLRGPTRTIVEHRRPIELQSHLLVGDKGSTDPHLVPLSVKGRTNPDGNRFDVDKPIGSYQRSRQRSRFYTPRRVETVERLVAENLLPAIYFIFSRNGCDEAATRCFNAGLRLTSSDERLRIREIVEERTEMLSDADLDALGYDSWLAGMEQGIAAHHAGMIPAFREAVEACFVEGLVKAVFATETLALGINMPARSVVIEKLSKFNGERHQTLTPGQFTQLTGRAGRRGIDSEGHAIVLWSPFNTFAQVAELAMSREFPLRSSFRPTYNMAANLVDRYDRQAALGVLARSFAQFQSDRSIVRMKTRQSRLAGELVQLGSDDDDLSINRIFDVPGYVDLLEQDRGHRQSHRSDSASVNASLARLKPGDVIDSVDAFRSRRVVVLSVSTRKGGSPRVKCLDADGRTTLIDPENLSEAVVALGRLKLPTPFAPKDPTFKRGAARSLRKAFPVPKRPRASKMSGASPALKNHPLHDHPNREELVRQHLSRRRLSVQLDEIEREMKRRGAGLADRMDAIISVLEATGHVADWKLTPSGERLRHLYHESDLLLSLALTGGLFDELEPPDVAALASCFTYEHRSSEPPLPPSLPSGVLRLRFEALSSEWHRLNGIERRAKVPPTREPQAGFAQTAWAWAAGSELDLVLDDDMSGGDFVRNIRQLVDLLAQLGDAAAAPSTRAAARSATDALRRGVILASGGPG